jgi:hypothetical protein
VADLLGGQGRRPPEARAPGAGGVQALAGALDDQLADELRQRVEDVEDQPSDCYTRRLFNTLYDSPPGGVMAVPCSNGDSLDARL